MQPLSSADRDRFRSIMARNISVRVRRRSRPRLHGSGPAFGWKVMAARGYPVADFDLKRAAEIAARSLQQCCSKITGLGTTSQFAIRRIKLPPRIFVRECRSHFRALVVEPSGKNAMLPRPSSRAELAGKTETKSCSPSIGEGEFPMNDDILNQASIRSDEPIVDQATIADRDLTIPDPDARGNCLDALSQEKRTRFW